MAKTVLVLGGARSGKSRFASQLADELVGDGEVTYLATAEPGDEEMADRILRHRRDRPPEWRTAEVPIEVAVAVEELGTDAAGGPGQSVILLDCITLWISNLLLAEEEETAMDREEAILAKVRTLARVSSEVDAHVILVSNEVGLGVVPPTQLGRAFRDIAGRANQILAQAADEVYIVWAGLPQRVK